MRCWAQEPGPVGFAVSSSHPALLCFKASVAHWGHLQKKVRLLTEKPTLFIFRVHQGEQIVSFWPKLSCNRAEHLQESKKNLFNVYLVVMLLLKYPTILTSIECKWVSGFFLTYIVKKSLTCFVVLLASKVVIHWWGKENQNLTVAWFAQSLVLRDNVRHLVVIAAAAAEHPTQLRLCFSYTVLDLENKLELSNLQ